jgi:hypothetical protein
MERIRNILQRLQDLYYSNHQKSAIDVDLMLDYTRVMYADLLEWRKQFKEPPTTETAEKNTPVITNEEEKEESKEQKQQVSQVLQAEEQVSDVKPEKEPEAEIPKEESVENVTTEEKNAPKPQQVTVQQETIFQPIERDEPAPKELVIEETEPVVDIHPEKESVNALMTDASGISFEPPAKQETKSEVIKEEIAVEAPVVNQPVEEMPGPAPVEIPLPDMASIPRKVEPLQSAQLFHAAKAANKDIRSSIGINDKYLFLNELFNNHKSNYEETLDKLNHFSNIDQARDWIITKVVPVQKWDKEDATVQSFYDMLAKHFSDR